jgi:hypothetical protein
VRAVRKGIKKAFEVLVKQSVVANLVIKLVELVRRGQLTSNE